MSNEGRKSLVITVIVVLIIIVLVYLLTAIFVTGEIGDKKVGSTTTKSSTTVSYGTDYNNMIIAGDVFNKSESKYMVIFYSKSSVSDDVKTMMKAYDDASKSLKLYKVDMDEAVNAYVKSSKSNKDATKSSDLKVNGTTLITIESGKISSYTEKESEILTQLK